MILVNGQSFGLGGNQFFSGVHWQHQQARQHEASGEGQEHEDLAVATANPH